MPRIAVGGTIGAVTWVLWVLVVLVIGGCVVLAVGRGGEMRESYDDRRDVLVPGDRPLGPEDLRAVRFTTAFRGYRMAEVDALIARVAGELDAAQVHEQAERSDDVTSFARQQPEDPHAG